MDVDADISKKFNPKNINKSFLNSTPIASKQPSIVNGLITNPRNELSSNNHHSNISEHTNYLTKSEKNVTSNNVRSAEQILETENTSSTSYSGDPSQAHMQPQIISIPQTNPQTSNIQHSNTQIT